MYPGFWGFPGGLPGYWGAIGQGSESGVVVTRTVVPGPPGRYRQESRFRDNMYGSDYVEQSSQPAVRIGDH